tara:strand:+ start:264 stop:470 length:207 start_codon:yes stop_codon:yes gene_type:complete
LTAAPDVKDKAAKTENLIIEYVDRAGRDRAHHVALAQMRQVNRQVQANQERAFAQQMSHRPRMPGISE